MKNTKAVFEFGNEYIATEFWDVDINAGGVEISLDGEHLGSIIGISIPDIEDIDENKKFDNEVIEWIVDNEK